MTLSRKLLLTGGVVLVVLLGLILWWKWEDVRGLFGGGGKTTPDQTETKNEDMEEIKKDVAKEVLDYLYHQKDARGIYADMSRCYINNATGAQWCEVIDDSNRAGMSVMWARWRYYQKNSANSGELDRLQEDLVAYEEMLDSGEYVINNDYFSCLFMEELANGETLGTEYRDIARRICVESKNEVFSTLDDTLEELRTTNAQKIKSIVQGNYDFEQDKFLAEFSEFSRESGWKIESLSRYPYYAADEPARIRLTGMEDDRSYQELLTQALTYYLVQKRDNKHAMEDDCAMALAIVMGEGWQEDADKKKAVDSLLSSDEEMLGDTCYLAHYKAGHELTKWQVNEVSNFMSQEDKLGGKEVNFYIMNTLEDGTQGEWQLLSSNISNAIKVGILNI